MPENQMSARPDDHRERTDPSAEHIGRRAAQLGFDPVRVAAALGGELDPNRLELVPDEPAARGRFER